MKIPKTVLWVSHRTTYRYSTYVETAQHLATIRPQNCAWQRVISHTESIEPKPPYINNRVDTFGNDVLYFSLESPHRSLQMVSETTVELTPRWASLDPAATPAWDEVAKGMRFSARCAVSPRDGVLLCVAEHQSRAGPAGLCAGEFSCGQAAGGGGHRPDAPDSCRLQVQAFGNVL